MDPFLICDTEGDYWVAIPGRVNLWLCVSGDFSLELPLTEVSKTYGPIQVIR